MNCFEFQKARDVLNFHSHRFCSKSIQTTLYDGAGGGALLCGSQTGCTAAGAGANDHVCSLWGADQQKNVVSARRFLNLFVFSNTSPDHGLSAASNHIAHIMLIALLPLDTSGKCQCSNPNTAYLSFSDHNYPFDAAEIAINNPLMLQSPCRMNEAVAC